MKANTHQRTQYIGTFVKASGEARTMRFTTSPEKITGRGLITVWDVERRGLRKFNLATLVGRLTSIGANEVSFCG